MNPRRAGLLETLRDMGASLEIANGGFHQESLLQT